MNKVERTLRGFYKYGEPEGLGKIYTPKELRDRMIEIAKPEKTDKILVLYNIEFASDFRDYENVVFASDDRDKNEIVREAFGMETIFVEENKKIGKNLEGMKFDLIISNPPYNCDIQILDNVYDITDNVCFIHPASWLYDNKNKFKPWVALKTKLEKSLVYYENIVNHRKIFNIDIPQNIFITLFKHDAANHINIWEIDNHGDSEIYKQIKNKILNYTKNKDNFYNHISDTRKDYATGIGLIGASRPEYADFLWMIRIRTKHVDTYENINYKIKFSFDSIVEAQNCEQFLKTKIARFCLSIFKISANLKGELASVPYMPTYDRPWTDEEVAAELGLTDEELAWAINWVPDGYPEDKEKYAKYKNL